ncbi:unnamed protein product [Oikopleura dioica]|uniref:Leucine-rich repeat-containing protein 51 n=1 Tax=Oikopleura dioica TaxID=34765 RepID=E4YRG0_OIKDI|nr:unnamed protein product [Oikopleura dioica]
MEKNLVAVTVAGLAYYFWNQHRKKEEKEETAERWFENITTGRIADSSITIASSPGQGKTGIKCFLIRLCKVDLRICYELMAFLRDEDVVKLGCGIDGDFKRLSEVDFVIFHPATISFFDLRQIIPATNYQNGGLANLTRQILGRKLNKDYRVRCSNWEADTLSNEQKTYAADDAVCALQILGKLIQELGESRVQYFINEYKNTVFKQKSKPNKDKKEKSVKITQNALEEKVKRRLETRDYGSDYFNSASASVRKEPLYNNCVKLLAPDGEVLSITDKKKADWYVKKGLGELVEDTETSFIVRLKFEPSGRPNTDSEKYYVTEKENVCVVCNEKNGLLRKNVVPREYRKHFPIVMKCHVSHDVVLLCLRCHGRSNELDYLKRARIADKFVAPLGNADLAKAILEPKERRNVRSGGNALLKNRAKLPEKRINELESIIMEYFNATVWTGDLEQKASDLPVLAGSEEEAQSFVQHGEKVVASLMTSGGIESLLLNLKGMRESRLSMITNRPETSDPADFSFLFLSNMKDLQEVAPRESAHVKKISDGKYNTASIRLSNNIIVELTGFSTAMESIINNAFNALQSVDLSFNEIHKIDASFDHFPNIRSLYLHGNQINSLNEVKKLRSLTKLKRLTLHGNPIDNLPNYRLFILYIIPTLQTFDFSGVSGDDHLLYFQMLNTTRNP